MRIFFVSNDFAGASLARRLVLEGHEVRAFVADPTCERIMLGLIPRLPSLDAGLDWIGPDGLAVVDDTGFGEWQDAARADGYAVVGGSALGDRLENDRALGHGHPQLVRDSHPADFAFPKLFTGSRPCP